MPPSIDPALLISVQIVVLAIPALALAIILRLASAPGGRSGAAIAGGVLAGVLLGPGVLGSAWPEWHDPILQGGVSEHQALREMQREHGREVTALRAADVSPAAMNELIERQRGQAAPLIDALSAARNRHRERLNDLGLALAALVMLAAAPSIAPRALSHAILRPGRSLITAAISLTVSVGLPLLIWRWITGDSWAAALALGLVVGAPAASAALRAPIWLPAALGGLLALALTTSLAPQSAALAVCIPLAAGLVISRFWRLRDAADLLLFVVLPIATALLCVRFDLRALASDPSTRWAFWWGLVIALVWSSDGRMFSWMLGIRVARLLPTETRLWTPASRLVNSGVDVLTIALALVLARAGAASEPILASAMWAAALVTITPTMRLTVSRWLDSSPSHPN